MLAGRKKIAVLLIMLLAASITLFFNREFLVIDSAYILDSPSDAYMDGDGGLYVIDRSKMDIVKAAPDGSFAYVIHGGENSENGFYNVNEIAFSPDGRVFVHGLRFEGQSLYLADERILEYTSGGRFVRELYKVSYDHSGLEPRQEGLIHGLDYQDGLLRFTHCGEAGISVYELSDGKDAVLTYQIPISDAWRVVQDVCVSPDGQRVFYTNKLGELWEVSVAGSARLDTRPSADSVLESTPYKLALASSGSLLFSDLGTWSVRAIDLETGSLKTVFGIADGAPVPDFEEREILYSISVAGSDAITVGDAIYAVGPDWDVRLRMDSFPFSAGRIALIAIMWVLCLLSAVIGLYLFAKLVLVIFTRSSIVKLAAAVVVLTIVISFFISALVISGMNANIEEHNKQTILYVTSLGASLTDGEALSRITSNKDYQNEDYNAIKAVLDEIQHKSDMYELDLYYLLYKNIGDIALGVMDSEDLVSPAYPYGISPEFYDQSAYEGKIVYGQVGDTTGMWGFALCPVLDASGEIAGVLEIGIDLNAHLQFLRGQVTDVILNVFAIAVVFILLTIEVATFMPFIRLKERAVSESAPYIMRILTFLLFAAYSLQDSFIPVLAMKSYTPIFGIPQSVGGALPITVEMLAIAVFSVVSGSLSSRVDRKRLMIFGPSLVVVGFMMIAVNSTFWFLMAGKFLIGSGLGISITMINGAAAGLPVNIREQAFDGISFGMISGMQVGIVVGSLVVGFLGYSIVFYLSAAITLAALVLSAFLLRPAQPALTPVREKKPGLLRFIFNPRTGGFLFLILAPALTVATLVEYYIPIFASDNQLTEANVGQISLIYGIFIILVGPAISPRLLSRIGAARGVSLAVLTAVLGIALFALLPGIPSMLVMVFMYGVSQSFGISARYSRFASFREVERYGSDRAMGVYGMFENLAQSFAPILIASVMALGLSAGASIIGLFIMGAFIIYSLIHSRRREE